MSDRLPGISYDNPIWYRGYRVHTGPGYTRDSLWEYSHEDFDGAPSEYGNGPADQRFGMCATIHECRAEIDEYEDSLRHCDDCGFSTTEPDVTACPHRECRGSVG